MRKLIFLFIGFFICSCDIQRGIPVPCTEKEQLANEILARVALKLCGKTDLILIGTGGGMIDQVDFLSLSFNYPHHITIQEARELLITSVQTFLSEINSNESIRPYLQNYPFKSDNVEVVIFLRNDGGSFEEQEVLQVIRARDGSLSYDIEFFGENNFGRLKTIYKESYEQALKKVKFIKK